MADPGLQVDPNTGRPIVTIYPPTQAGAGGWGEPWTPQAPQGAAAQTGQPTAAGDAGGGWGEPWTPQQPSNQPPPTQLGAAGRGAADAATFGFEPAIAGLSAASGMQPAAPGENDTTGEATGYENIAGAIASPFVGAYKMATGQPGASQAYDQARQQELEANQAAEQAYPKTYLASQAAASLAVPVGGGLGAASTAARVGRSALSGAIGGGLYGAGTATSEGEGVGGVAKRAAGGAAAGAVVGGALGGAVETGSHIARRVGSVVRGHINPEKEGTRIAQEAFQGEAQRAKIQKRTQDTEALEAGNEAGTPLTIGDFAGEPAHARLRAAANISPEAREHIGEFVQGRYYEQSQRFGNWIRSKFGVSDNPELRAALKSLAGRALDPLYLRAYKAGEKGVISKELLRLAGAPSVRQAIGQALPAMKDRGIIAGFKVPKRNPFSYGPDGVARLTQDAKGNKILPDIAYWDHVIRNMNGEIGTLLRAGNNEHASRVIQLKNELLRILDKEVPEYRAARGGASRFFSAQDAIEAGENFVTDSGITNGEAARAFAKMSSVEQKLFSVGFANRLADLIEAKGDSANVLNNMFVNSRRARQRIQIALGPDGAAEFEALMRIEGLIDRTRKATVGNSTTMRQASDHSLIGGVGIAEAFHGALNPVYIIAGALILGGRAAARQVDEQVAIHVANMLLSDDPAVLNRGYQIVAKNPVFRDALRRASDIGTRQLINYIGPSGVAAAGMSLLHHGAVDAPAGVTHPSDDQYYQNDTGNGVN